jgi:hypothetical protein
MNKGTCPKLEIIDLNGNCIKDEGCHHIAAYSRDGGIGRLKTLDLRYNDIGTLGARSISALIRGKSAFPFIVQVNLRYNRVGADGMQFLTEG